ncbi:MAG: hypothetical protein DSY46_01920 [Hydrogenimonas sp.]|nr:MAG: hypothetical protein DSY46_01920 [Hydrogenimonas sp.]
MYDQKDSSYFHNVRKELLDLIPETNRGGRVLEIGAGSGSTLRYAKEHHYAKEIFGIELCALESQDMDAFDGFVIGDIESMESLPFEKGSFDVILCADVLEHLIDHKLTWNLFDEFLATQYYLVVGKSC